MQKLVLVAGIVALLVAPALAQKSPPPPPPPPQSTCAAAGGTVVLTCQPVDPTCSQYKPGGCPVSCTETCNLPPAPAPTPPPPTGK
jgi:hypothetical protein